MTAEQYPTANGQAGPNLGYAYDTMGRLNTLTDLTAQSSIISGTTYGPSNELLTMSGLVTETRTYNSMLQLLSLVASASAGPTVNLTYAYSSTQNNGKITSQTDNLSGEQVVYTYDALNRLASAAATSNSWGQSFSYDGFGNLTGQTVTAGSAPSYSVTPDPSTNHLGGEDANGNAPYSNDANGTNYVMAYDVENRYTGSLTSTGSFAYGYAPGNKRVYRGVANGSTLATDEVTYWSATGQKLATYEMVFSGSQWIATQTGTYYWFGGKLIRNAAGYVTADRLGSIGHFYPYGLEKPSATTNGTEKFTGYLRDAETGLDYAKNRYHDPGTGRFMTPDPYIASAGPTDPGSWNRYSYTRGDPVNRADHNGLYDCDPNVDCDEAPPRCGPGDEDDPDCDCYLDCQHGGAGDPQPNPPPPPPPPPGHRSSPATCSISLDERPVSGTPADHAFIDASIDFSNGVSTEEIIDGGPTWGLSPTGALLTGWNTPGSVGYYAADNPALPTTVQVGASISGVSVCAKIAKLSSEVLSYDSGSKVAYNPVPSLYLGGWNSNSFAYTLLNSVGLAFSYGPLPAPTPGWGYQVAGPYPAIALSTMRLTNIALTAVLLSGYGCGAPAGEDLPYQAAVFDAGTGPAGKKVVRLFPVRGGQEADIELPGPLRVLAVAPGGRVLYASPSEGPAVLQPPAPGLFAVDLRPVGKSLLPGSSEFVFPTSMAVSSDGKKLLVSGAAMVDGKASCGVYELIPATGGVRKIVSAVSCQREEAWGSLSFSNDGSRAAAIHRKRLEVIDLSSGEMATVGDGFYGAAWSPDGKWIAAREYSGKLRTVILDARTFRRVRTLEDAEMAWSPDSRYLLSFVLLPSCVLEFYTLERIDIQSGRSSSIESSRCKAAGGQAAWVSATLKP